MIFIFPLQKICFYFVNFHKFSFWYKRFFMYFIAQQLNPFLFTILVCILHISSTYLVATQPKIQQILGTIKVIYYTIEIKISANFLHFLKYLFLILVLSYISQIEEILNTPIYHSITHNACGKFCCCFSVTYFQAKKM